MGFKDLLGRRFRRVELGEDSYSNSRYLWNVKVGKGVRVSYNVHAQGRGVDFYGKYYEY